MFRKLARFVHHHASKQLFLDKINAHCAKDKIAFYGKNGPKTYRELRKSAIAISNMVPKSALKIGFLCQRSEEYVQMQWGIWNAKCVAIPLFQEHPVAELVHIAQQSKMDILYYDPLFHDKVTQMRKQLPAGLVFSAIDPPSIPMTFENEKLNASHADAQILYTSGTTGKPKGVMMTHHNLACQMQDIVAAWNISSTDHTIHCLPLHHTHGILNQMLSMFYAGGSIAMMEKFNTKGIWQHFLNDQQKVTLFMAVPTIYQMLYDDFISKTADEQERLSKSMSSLRLMISGSMACPKMLIREWKKISSHTLIERYGMTELGMVLTNVIGEADIGYVGLPFLSVNVRLVNENDEIVFEYDDTKTISMANYEGELQVQGPTVFSRYYLNEKATKKAFTKDGWFKTGDLAAYDAEKNKFRVVGRLSADIIKVGGYKISGLEIEQVMMDTLSCIIQECAVIGVPDCTLFGERAVAIVVLRKNEKQELIRHQIMDTLGMHLAKYKLPRTIHFVSAIPRNAMGKINKKDLIRKFMLEELS